MCVWWPMVKAVSGSRLAHSAGLADDASAAGTGRYGVMPRAAVQIAERQECLWVDGLSGAFGCGNVTWPLMSSKASAVSQERSGSGGGQTAQHGWRCRVQDSVQLNCLLWLPALVVMADDATVCPGGQRWAGGSAGA